MEKSIVISGFGGQGTLFAGQILAYAAMDAGKHVTWIPSYGPEMRGGTANCTVVISDEEIGSPIVSSPDIVIAMNLPSVDKYEPIMNTGTTMIVNRSLVDRGYSRDDLNIVDIMANEISEEMGNVRLANMLLLAVMLKHEPILSIDSIKQALVDHLPDRHKKTLDLNQAVLDKGYSL